jgi:hypothetical protein
MIYTPLLVDEAGNPVLCRIRHSTCQFSPRQHRHSH